MSSASGEAKVESKRGSIAIEAEFSNLDRPTSFGSEYLTYVLWAISPEGRPVNLGEVLVGDNSRSKLKVTTNLQAFALIVTAEPYYAVQQPSNVVVLENVVRADTRGTAEEVHAKYELMERGGYLPTGYKIDPIVLNAHLPLEFYEARNAMRIAKSEGAEQYAEESYGHALKLMDKADQNAIDKHHHSKELIAISREAVQTAEDARSIAVKKMDVGSQPPGAPGLRKCFSGLARRKPTMRPAALNAPRLTLPLRNPTPRVPSLSQLNRRLTWPQASKRLPMP